MVSVEDGAALACLREAAGSLALPRVACAAGEPFVAAVRWSLVSAEAACAAGARWLFVTVLVAPGATCTVDGGVGAGGGDDQ